MACAFMAAGSLTDAQTDGSITVTDRNTLRFEKPGVYMIIAEADGSLTLTVNGNVLTGVPMNQSSGTAVVGMYYLYVLEAGTELVPEGGIVSLIINKIN